MRLWRRRRKRTRVRKVVCPSKSASRRRVRRASQGEVQIPRFASLARDDTGRHPERSRGICTSSSPRPLIPTRTNGPALSRRPALRDYAVNPEQRSYGARGTRSQVNSEPSFVFGSTVSRTYSVRPALPSTTMRITFSATGRIRMHAQQRRVRRERMLDLERVRVTLEQEHRLAERRRPRADLRHERRTRRAPARPDPTCRPETSAQRRPRRVDAREVERLVDPRRVRLRARRKLLPPAMGSSPRPPAAASPTTRGRCCCP